MVEELLDQEAIARKLLIDKMVDYYGPYLTPATLGSYLDSNIILRPFHLYLAVMLRHYMLKPYGRLIISAPPRHGKSLFGTILSTLWYLEHFPLRNVIIACADMRLAETFGGDIRNYYENFGANGRIAPLLRNQLDPRKKSRSSFSLYVPGKRAGGVECVGIGGNIMGRGGDVVFCDDYIKNDLDAYNMDLHEKHYRWFTRTLSTRVQSGASTFIVIATRWHRDDLIGQLVSKQPGEWTHVSIPAVCNSSDDVLGREIGEELWDRYNWDKFLSKQKETMGILYDAIYQQAPRDSGNFDKSVNDFIFYDAGGEGSPRLNSLEVVRAWDTGGTSSKRSDPTVGAKCGYDRETGRFYIMDIFRERLSSLELDKEALRLSRDDSLASGGRYEVLIEREPASQAIHFIEHFKNAVLKDFKVVSCSANQNKQAKAHGFLAACQAGNVYVRNGDKWQKSFLHEYVQFPSGLHDDQIDAISIAYNYLVQKHVSAGVWGSHISPGSYVYGENVGGNNPCFWGSEYDDIYNYN